MNKRKKHEKNIDTYVWFLEHKNKEWLTKDFTITSNPLEAIQFTSKVKALIYRGTYSIQTKFKPTEHLFI